MLVDWDAGQLEWRACAHLARDATAIQEICEGADFHSDNQRKFNLPSRLIAKVFLFRTIYCPRTIAEKTAYAFSVDNDFKDVGGQKFWLRAVNAFYDKYQGIEEYHNDLIRTAQLTGQIISETGRVYPFSPKQVHGEWMYPISDIANYPVSGFSADIMSLARVCAYNRIEQYKREKEKPNIHLVNTVHDSLIGDIGYNLKTVIEVGKIMKGVFADIPANYKKIYKKDLLVPMECGMKVGNNWSWMHKINI